MKSKLKTLLSLYVTFQLIVACECPPVTYYNWDIKSFSSAIYYDSYEDSYIAVLNADSTYHEEVASSSFLQDFGPNKAMAMTRKCDTESFVLITKFDGISIKSSADFSNNKPVGTELKDLFLFSNYGTRDTFVGFEEVMNRRYNQSFYMEDFRFYGKLIEKPSEDKIHEFTFTFYLNGGDSLLTTTREIEFLE